MSVIRARVEKLGLALPPVPPAAANYQAALQSDLTLIVSGQLPRTASGDLHATGKVGDAVDLPTAVACARHCALNALSLIDHHFHGAFEHRLDRLLRVAVYVASAADFTRQHLVADGASDLLKQVLGPRGDHARVAVGCVALPLDAPVEVEMMAALTDPNARGD